MGKQVRNDKWLVVVVVVVVVGVVVGVVVVGCCCFVVRMHVSGDVCPRIMSRGMFV